MRRSRRSAELWRIRVASASGAPRRRSASARAALGGLPRAIRWRGCSSRRAAPPTGSGPGAGGAASREPEEPAHALSDLVRPHRWAAAPAVLAERIAVRAATELRSEEHTSELQSPYVI